MNFGNAITLIRTSFNAVIDTLTLTANRTYNLPDKSGTFALLDDVGSGGSSNKVVNTITENKTLLLSDSSTIIRCNNTDGLTITIPSANVFPIGYSVDIVQINTGQVTIVGEGGEIIKKIGGTGNAILIGRFAGCSVTKLVANEWYATGDISI